METSAKTALNVNDLFLQIGEIQDVVIRTKINLFCS